MNQNYAHEHGRIYEARLWCQTKAGTKIARVIVWSQSPEGEFHVEARFHHNDPCLHKIRDMREALKTGEQIACNFAGIFHLMTAAEQDVRGPSDAQMHQ
jgi:hypothetical protein